MGEFCCVLQTGKTMSMCSWLYEHNTIAPRVINFQRLTASAVGQEHLPFLDFYNMIEPNAMAPESRNVSTDFLLSPLCQNVGRDS
jgi:hypothetical protein